MPSEFTVRHVMAGVESQEMKTQRLPTPGTDLVPPYPSIHAECRQKHQRAAWTKANEVQIDLGPWLLSGQQSWWPELGSVARGLSAIRLSI